MKRVLLFVAACVLSTAAIAQGGLNDAEMKALQESMMPGELHIMMAKWDGTWTTTNKMWMDPAAPPQVTAGTCVNRMVLGGRFQESRLSGTMMGMPFEGLGMLGYDKTKKKFTSTWMDNMGTGIMVLEGVWDAAGRRLNLSGTTTDPMTGEDVRGREVYTIKDNEDQLMEMWMTDPKTGKELKMMEIAFVRK